jgi:hypothetical protein
VELSDVEPVGDEDSPGRRLGCGDGDCDREERWLRVDEAVSELVRVGVREGVLLVAGLLLAKRTERVADGVVLLDQDAVIDCDWLSVIACDNVCEGDSDEICDNVRLLLCVIVGVSVPVDVEI